MIIDDLRQEIKILKEEQSRLIQSRFGSIKDEQYQQELLVLQERIGELEKQIAGHLKDKSELNAQLLELSGIFFF